jgi:hypothetical protein
MTNKNVKKAPPFIERVIGHWRSNSVEYLPGVSEDELRSFEHLLDIRLPDDMCALYLATNGLRVPGTDGVDERNYDFWPLTELQLAEGSPAALYFADFQQSSWTFAIGLVGDGTVRRGAVYVAAGRFIEIAHSFAHFMDLYIEDDDSLYWSSWKDR